MSGSPNPSCDETELRSIHSPDRKTTSNDFNMVFKKSGVTEDSVNRRKKFSLPDN